MDETCRYCKWWDQREDVQPGYGICDLATGGWFIPPETKVVVRPQLNAGLVTAPDFGCNQHEPKES